MRLFRLVLEVVGDEAYVDDARRAADALENVGFAVRGRGLDDADGPAGGGVDVVDFEASKAGECLEHAGFGAGGKRDDNGGLVHVGSLFHVPMG